jgi:hypothetical protein
MIEENPGKFVLMHIGYDKITYLNDKNEFVEHFFQANAFTKQEIDERLKYYTRSEFVTHGFLKFEQYDSQRKAIRKEFVDEYKKFCEKHLQFRYELTYPEDILLY